MKKILYLMLLAIMIATPFNREAAAIPLSDTETKQLVTIVYEMEKEAKSLESRGLTDEAKELSSYISDLKGRTYEKGYFFSDPAYSYLGRIVLNQSFFDASGVTGVDPTKDRIGRLVQASFLIHEDEHARNWGSIIRKFMEGPGSEIYSFSKQYKWLKNFDVPEKDSAVENTIKGVLKNSGADPALSINPQTLDLAPGETAEFVLKGSEVENPVWTISPEGGTLAVKNPLSASYTAPDAPGLYLLTAAISVRRVLGATANFEESTGGDQGNRIIVVPKHQIAFINVAIKPALKLILPKTGVVGEKLQATIVPNAAVPASTIYVWNFGDGTKQESGTAPERTHVYANARNPYTITVWVSGKSSVSTKEYVKITGKATPAVEDVRIKELQKTKWVDIGALMLITTIEDVKWDGTDTSKDGTKKDTASQWIRYVVPGKPAFQIKWNGLSFSGTGDITEPDATWHAGSFSSYPLPCKRSTQIQVSGSFNAQLTELTSFKITMKSSLLETQKPGDEPEAVQFKESLAITASNIPVNFASVDSSQTITSEKAGSVSYKYSSEGRRFEHWSGGNAYQMCTRKNSKEGSVVPEKFDIKFRANP